MEEIGTKHKRVPLFVEKFIEFLGGCGSDFPGKNVKVFKGRRLNILVSVQPKLSVDQLLNRELPRIFLAIYIAHALRRMDKPVIHHIILLKR